jgi:hypothetical protein
VPPIISLQIDGIADIRQQLGGDRFTRLIERALVEALAPVRSAIAAAAPKRTGRLARDLRVKTSRRGGLTGVIAAGGYGHLVEYGHRIVTGGRLRKSKSLRALGLSAGRMIGQVPPHPFAVPVAESMLPEVAATIERRLAQELI